MRSALVILSTMVGLLVGPGVAQAAQKAIWGPLRTLDGSSAFPIYRQLGVDVLQYQLRWDRVAPTRPAREKNPRDAAYSWPREVTLAVRAARRNGMRVALLVTGSPGWANGGRPPHWAPNNRAYARFLTAASRRYRSVRHWMIWGEANRAAVFQPLPPNSPVGPRRYATLLRAAYWAINRVDHRDVVIGGMTFSFGDVMPRDFLRWMRVGRGHRKPPPLDWYGHNSFSRRFPRLSDGPFGGLPASADFGDLDRFHRQLRRTYRPHYKRFRHRGPRIWISEFTVSSDRPNRAFDFAKSRRVQARWLRAAYRIAHRNRWIAGLGWFNLQDEPAHVSGGLTTGLLTNTGRRKPAFHAYRRAR